MALEIPLRSDLTHFELQVPLEGRTYTLELRWSVREERWYLDVLTEERDPIYVGIALVLNFRLGARCVDERWFPGALFCVDTSGAQLDPGIEDLGERVKLVYFEASELPIDVSEFLES